MAVEINTALLEETCVRSTLSGENAVQLVPINCTPKYLIVTPYTDDTDEIWTKALISKSTYWDYEKEFRLVSQSGARKKMKLLENTISGVYLGVRIEEENRNQVIKILQNRGDHIPLYQAVMDRREYKLGFDSVAY